MFLLFCTFGKNLPLTQKCKKVPLDSQPLSKFGKKLVLDVQSLILILQDSNQYDSSWVWLAFGFFQSTITQLGDFIFIDSPVSKYGTTNLREMADKYITTGEKPIRSIDNNKSDGFNIRIGIPYEAWEGQNGYFLYELVTSTGDQTGSKFEITKINKTESGQFLNYDIECKINCKLYETVTAISNGEFFGEIKDGILVTRISIPKG